MATRPTGMRLPGYASGLPLSEIPEERDLEAENTRLQKEVIIGLEAIFRLHKGEVERQKRENLDLIERVKRDAQNRPSPFDPDTVSSISFWYRNEGDFVPPSIDRSADLKTTIENLRGQIRQLKDYHTKLLIDQNQILQLIQICYEKALDPRVLFSGTSEIGTGLPALTACQNKLAASMQDWDPRELIKYYHSVAAIQKALLPLIPDDAQ